MTVSIPATAGGSGGFSNSRNSRNTKTSGNSGVVVEAASVLPFIEDRSPRGIAAAVHRMIRGEQLRPGDRLPTVRELAVALGVSPATVSEAWQALGAVGAIQARGRAGTFVRDVAEPTRPTRYLGISGPTARSPQDETALDLSTGTPDPRLLPALREAVERFSTGATAWTSSYLDEPVLPELREQLEASWPFRPQRLTVLDGALDALSRVVDQVVGLGDRVVMESPGFPPLIDMLERAGAEIIAVTMDEQGIVPQSLTEALQAAPVAVFVQPRAQNPTGTSMTRLRSSQLAEVLAGSRAWVVEDDHCGDISLAEDVSIGQFLPERCVHIRSYSKSHGPDLRIAAIGGAAEVIDPLIARRMLGPGWTSRLLQAVLLDLLTHHDPQESVRTARIAYARRGTLLREKLKDRGIDTSPGDGINVWIPVADERSALITLAALGIRVAPGSPFVVGTANDQTDAIRVTTGRLPDDDIRIDEIVEAIAQAAGSPAGVKGNSQPSAR
jgi:DNA-binding transcriptional MocR family regulator